MLGISALTWFENRGNPYANLKRMPLQINLQNCTKSRKLQNVDIKYIKINFNQNVKPKFTENRKNAGKKHNTV